MDPGDVLREVEILPTGLNLQVYRKPTDKRTLLNAESSHPLHVKKAIAYTVGLRMKRLCSREEDLKKALIEQAWALLGRGHQEQWIIEGFSKALL